MSEVTHVYIHKINTVTHHLVLHMQDITNNAIVVAMTVINTLTAAHEIRVAHKLLEQSLGSN